MGVEVVVISGRVEVVRGSFEVEVSVGIEVVVISGGGNVENGISDVDV